MQPADKRQWVLAAVDAYEVRLRRYALRLLGDADLAGDAVQHTFLKLCDQSVESVGDRLGAWLFRVCRNRAVDHLRQAGREQSLESGDERGAPPASRETGPAEASELRELGACLRELVADLPPAQRETIDLWSEGFSYRQIAEITGRQEGHVRVLVHRGLSALRQHPRVRAWLEDVGQASRLPELRIKGRRDACPT
jgi:RNA polymerase sigma-70 factor (ECF subfamily)